MNRREEIPLGFATKGQIMEELAHRENASKDEVIILFDRDDAGEHLLRGLAQKLGYQVIKSP
jgi:5S rRNA maturation endonuclease (ribonuclease M5)